MAGLLTIFEGPDGGGKSTLAHEYAEATGAEYIHNGPYNGVEDIGAIYASQIARVWIGGVNVVLDRAWLSEAIYGHIFRGASRLTQYQLDSLDDMAIKCGAVQVICLPPREVCLANYRSRKQTEMLDNEEQLRLVHERYGWMKGLLPTTYHDYTNPAIYKKIKELRK